MEELQRALFIILRDATDEGFRNQFYVLFYLVQAQFLLVMLDTLAFTSIQICFIKILILFFSVSSVN